MVDKLRTARGKQLHLVVDGKQKVVCNAWTIVTCSFIARSEAVSDTTLTSPAGLHARARVHTATAEPFLQALMDVESKHNMLHCFNMAIQLAREHCDLDLRAQVRQVHKDFAKGINAARREAFPHSRPCDDYAHMVRAAGSRLQALLRQTRVSATGPSPPVQPSGACGQMRGRATAKGGRGRKAKDPRQRVWAKTHLQPLMRLVHLTRTLPTIQLYDAVWQVLFRCMSTRWGEAGAAKYLFDEYFEQVPLKDVQKVARVHALNWSASGMLFSGHWSGILGTHPGAASGSQTIEAFHSFWQRTLQAASRARVDAVLPTMQRLFRETWSSQFAWGTSRSWTLYPRAWSSVFVHGQQLRATKRSPAVDYWQHRQTPNYHHVVHETAPVDLAPAHTTTFWVMRAAPVGVTLPAEAIVDKPTADTIVGLIMSEGATLTARLVEAGVVSGGPGDDECTVDAEMLRKCFHDHAVVMEGQLIDSYWPRMRKGTLEHAPATVCTCWSYMLYAECEHVVFVHALPGPYSCKFRGGLWMHGRVGRVARACVRPRACGHALRGRTWGMATSSVGGLAGSGLVGAVVHSGQGMRTE